MLLSTTLDFCCRNASVKEGVKMIFDAGFKAYDCTLCGQSGARIMADSEDWREQALELRAYADELGIVCNQAHAFFHSSTGDETKDQIIFQKIVRDMEIASILGAKIIVVHPKQHLKYAEHPDELYEMNVEFYKNLIPYCKKFGIKVAVENMWQYNGITKAIVDSTCARAWEFCKYVDALDSKWIVACLDIGHAGLTDSDIAAYIKTLGSRLQALHVHDNDLKNDDHFLPFTKNIDFDKVTSALAEIDYQGDFTYEADFFLQRFPTELTSAALKFMQQVGQHLVNEIERKRK